MSGFGTGRRRKRERLIDSIKKGDTDKLAKLLSTCSPNYVDQETGETPLTLAAATASALIAPKLIQSLVDSGAVIDYRNKAGLTGLHVAAKHNNYAALKTFLELGASPNYRDNNGLTPLYYTVLFSSSPKLAQLLLHEHSVIGIQDGHGWQEVHHAAKLGLVNHLEQLLYYGCDINCRIQNAQGGSGNTPLHIAAINDQLECARVLLIRGCNTEIENNSHQTAYQLAVIAGAMNLAEMIQNHTSENVVPYRIKPLYSSVRQTNQTNEQPRLLPQLEVTNQEPRSTSSCLSHPDDDDYEGSICHDCQHAPASPCPSMRSCANSIHSHNTTSSSGFCCEDLGSHSEGDENDDVESNLFVPKSGPGDNQSLIYGRRSSRIGFVHLDRGAPGGRMNHMITANHRQSNSVSFNCNQSDSVDLYHSERMVNLKRGPKGFGFTLRGSKIDGSSLGSELESKAPISLQYFDEVEPMSVADLAGLKRGDFLLAVNGIDVRRKSHEEVVQLIRQSSESVSMTVVTMKPASSVDDSSYGSLPASYAQTENGASPNDSKLCDTEPIYATGESVVGSDDDRNSLSKGQMITNYDTLPRIYSGSSSTTNSVTSKASHQDEEKMIAIIRNKAPPPAPPKRDPGTTLSRARARSYLAANDTEFDGPMMSEKEAFLRRAHSTGLHDYDSEGRSTKSSSPTVSIESRTVGRMDDSGSLNSGNKVASLRSRVSPSRRISAYELEEAFRRKQQQRLLSNPESDSALTTACLNDFEYRNCQDMNTYSVTPKEKEQNQGRGPTLRGVKNKSKKRLHKIFSSTPDIQKDLNHTSLSRQSSNGSDNSGTLIGTRTFSSASLERPRTSSFSSKVSINSPPIVETVPVLVKTPYGSTQDIKRTLPPSYPPPPVPNFDASLSSKKPSLQSNSSKDIRGEYANLDSKEEMTTFKQLECPDTKVDYNLEKKIFIPEPDYSNDGDMSNSSQQSSPSKGSGSCSIEYKSPSEIHNNPSNNHCVIDEKRSSSEVAIVGTKILIHSGSNEATNSSQEKNSPVMAKTQPKIQGSNLNITTTAQPPVVARDVRSKSPSPSVIQAIADVVPPPPEFDAPLPKPVIYGSVSRPSNSLRASSLSVKSGMGVNMPANSQSQSSQGMMRHVHFQPSLTNGLPLDRSSPVSHASSPYATLQRAPQSQYKGPADQNHHYTSCMSGRTYAPSNGASHPNHSPYNFCPGPERSSLITKLQRMSSTGSQQMGYATIGGRPSSPAHSQGHRASPLYMDLNRLSLHNRIMNEHQHQRTLSPLPKTTFDRSMSPMQGPNARTSPDWSPGYVVEFLNQVASSPSTDQLRTGSLQRNVHSTASASRSNQIHGTIHRMAGNSSNPSAQPPHTIPPHVSSEIDVDAIANQNQKFECFI